MSLVFYSLIAIIGLSVFGTIALKPRLFWPILIIVTVGTGGIVIQSTGIMDEYFVVCILLGSMLAISIRVTYLQRIQENIWDHYHRWFFIIMVLYMILQSIRGVLLLEDLIKIHWIIFFSMLGILLFFISQIKFPFLSRRRISLIIASSSMGYSVLYITMGIYYEIVLGESKWNIQNTMWGGTTYAAFPLVIILPAILFLIQDKQKYAYRKIGWTALLILIFQSFYYDSRISWITILIFSIISLYILGFRKFFYIFLIFICILSIFTNYVWPEWYSNKVFLNVIFKSSLFIFNPLKAHDVGRLMHVRIGFPIISSNWKTLFFGYGFRASGPLIGPHLAELYYKYNMPRIAKEVMYYESTIGFTTLLIECGLLGVFLLSMNFFFVFRKIIIRKGNQRKKLILLTSLIMTYLWLFITNPLDIILFYLMIMPSGLLIQLSKDDKKQDL